LFDVHEPYVWVCITLTATAGGSLPSLSELEVLYPGQSLMDNLPAIYRRAEGQPGSFLRSLVGVLESTTQGFDARIASLASHVHPATSTGPWLDFVAGWLGLPWDDALDDEQKRRLLSRASEVARGRGTRAGLEALLERLFPGTPPRFRVTDATADVGFAIVGGGDCRGSTLPALLGGRSPWSTELDFSTVLGYMRLRCEGHTDDGAAEFAGRIRVDVAATGEERRAWEPWLAALIDDMVPLTARAQLRWVSAGAPHGGRLDGSLVLEAPPTPHLGSDAILGVARLPERGSRITASGADIGTRLQ
jgi:phage tail-like protein